MATAKQILGALNRSAEYALMREKDQPDQRAANFVAYFSGALRSLDEQGAEQVLCKVLGIEPRPPTDGA